MEKEIIVIKKNGTREPFDPEKIISATQKSANRIAKTWSEEEKKLLEQYVREKIEESGETEFSINAIHSMVEYALDRVDPKVANQYRNYRNWKQKSMKIFDEMEQAENTIRFIGDRSNANKDASLVATKRALIYGEYSTRRYEMQFLNEDEKQAAKDGYIYIHDKDSRLDTMNCFSRDTSFITEYGLRTFQDFKDGDSVKVLSHKAIWRNAVVHCYGKQKLQIVRFNECVNILCTENHRWLLADGSETTSLKVGDTLISVPECDSIPVSQTWTVSEMIETGDIADVWCLEVEKDHSFLLEGGIPTGNCCLFDMSHVLTGGFQMGNMWYNEPNTLDTAFDVMGDVILSAGAQQYGGFTVPEVDSVLLPFAQKSYGKYRKEKEEELSPYLSDSSEITKIAKEYAMKKTQRECEQGMQGIEYKLNTVSSSRGDYVFVTFSFGLAEGELAKMIQKTILNVRKDGQGKKGFKKPVLFPKLVFLYDKEKHGVGKEYEDVFDCAIECSSKAAYPDYLSLTGEGYVPSMYKKYKKAISPMGCRAFLSPWYERGGMQSADENDQPVFIGRFNLGVVSIHAPMILMKAMRENKNFYDVLDYYLNMIRKLHLRTIDYIGNLKAGSNPLCFCEGGLYGGHLNLDDRIAPILKSCTISFGITALNELQMLYNGKSIHEDGQFAYEVMEHINQKIDEYKKEDHVLYAIYASPAETLSGKQIQQFRAKYGTIEGVSSREYVTNSFHDAVWEPITPIEKQDDENRFWNLFNGGKIQYCRYNVMYNLGAMKTLVRRGMKKGFYEGVNLSLSYCNHCGHQELNMKVCPSCGSKNITTIDRMNGYLGFTRVGTLDGDKDYDSDPEKTGRFNHAKTVEISQRVSC